MLGLSVQEPHLYVGEPVDLDLVLRNDSHERIRGYFRPWPQVDDVTPPYRTDLLLRAGARAHVRVLSSQPVRTAAGGGVIGESLFLPRTLRPLQEERGSWSVAEDGEGQPLLSVPGSYEIRVVYWDQGDVEKSRIESDTVRLEVSGVPSGQTEAFDEFVEKRFGQLLEARDLVLDSAALALVDSAADFSEKYPASVYGQHVQKALMRLLHDYSARGDADARYKALYRTLKEHEGGVFRP